MAVAPPYALIDGNNFYVSCERVFDRKLEGVPVRTCSSPVSFGAGREASTKRLT